MTDEIIIEQLRETRKDKVKLTAERDELKEKFSKLKEENQLFREDIAGRAKTVERAVAKRDQFRELLVRAVKIIRSFPGKPPDGKACDFLLDLEAYGTLLIPPEGSKPDTEESKCRIDRQQKAYADERKGGELAGETCMKCGGEVYYQQIRYSDGTYSREMTPVCPVCKDRNKLAELKTQRDRLQKVVLRAGEIKTERDRHKDTLQMISELADTAPIERASSLAKKSLEEGWKTAEKEARWVPGVSGTIAEDCVITGGEKIGRGNK